MTETPTPTPTPTTQPLPSEYSPLFTLDNVHMAGKLLDELNQMVTDLVVMQLMDDRLVLPDPTAIATVIMPDLLTDDDVATMSTNDVAVFNVIESVTEFVFGAVREVIRMNQELIEEETQNDQS